MGQRELHSSQIPHRILIIIYTPLHILNLPGRPASFDVVWMTEHRLLFKFPGIKSIIRTAPRGMDYYYFFRGLPWRNGFFSPAYLLLFNSLLTPTPTLHTLSEALRKCQSWLKYLWWGGWLQQPKPWPLSPLHNQQFSFSRISEIMLGKLKEQSEKMGLTKQGGNHKPVFI